VVICVLIGTSKARSQVVLNNISHWPLANYFIITISLLYFSTLANWTRLAIYHHFHSASFRLLAVLFACLSVCYSSSKLLTNY